MSHMLYAPLRFPLTWVKESPTISDRLYRDIKQGVKGSGLRFVPLSHSPPFFRSILGKCRGTVLVAKRLPSIKATLLCLKRQTEIQRYHADVLRLTCPTVVDALGGIEGKISCQRRSRVKLALIWKSQGLEGTPFAFLLSVLSHRIEYAFLRASSSPRLTENVAAVGEYP